MERSRVRLEKPRCAPVLFARFFFEKLEVGRPQNRSNKGERPLVSWFEDAVCRRTDRPPIREVLLDALVAQLARRSLR